MLHKPYLHILFILFVTYTLVFAQRDTVAEKPKFVFKTSAIPTNKVRNSRVPLEFDLGNYMIEGKDYAGAIDMWQKCLQKDSRIAAACFNIGLANLILRKPDDARSAFERASELDPADAQTHIYLGKIYISINELNKAQSAFEKANELQSNDAEILNDLACVYDKQRKYAKALETINKAIAQKPDFLNANVNKLTFLNNMGLPDSVLALAPQLSAKFDKEPLTMVQLGIAQHKKKDFDAAIATFDSAIAIYKNLAIAHYHRAVSLFATNRNVESFAALQTAVDLAPELEVLAKTQPEFEAVKNTEQFKNIFIKKNK